MRGGGKAAGADHGARVSSRPVKDERKPHVADFVKVTEDGSTFYRVTCRETGEKAMHWPSYLRQDSPLTVWEDNYQPCAMTAHVNAKGLP